MADYVNLGGKMKRNKGRYGGESAHRQHIDDNMDKGVVAEARERSERRFVRSVLRDVSLHGTDGVDFDQDDVRTTGNGGSGLVHDVCNCTGLNRVQDGVVSDGAISLVFSGGKLLAAHCG